MEDLQSLKYKELQKLAKAARIKANAPKADLVNALIAFNNGNVSENKDETEKKPEDTGIKSTKKVKNSVTDDEDDKYPPFLLISSTGPAADHNNKSDNFGLYRKTRKMKEGRSVYKQQNDSNYETFDYKLFSDQGVWVMSGEWDEDLKAVAPSELPTSVKWQYIDEYSKWYDDPVLTVIRLNEKPSCECEVTISLSEDEDMQNKEIAGVYRADGSYRRGRPVLLHSEGPYILSVGYSGWRVEKPDDGDDWVVYCGSAPSQCPADPRAGSRGISLKCNKCVNNIDIANTKIKELERIIKTMTVEINELRCLN